MSWLRILASPLVILALLASHAPAGAAPRTPILSDYTHTAWDALKGAPIDVLKIAQDSDGWLWIATTTGLYRFDGVQFERQDSVYGHPLYSTDPLALAAAADGALWVGYRFGNVTMLGRDGARTFTTHDGLPSGAIFHIEIAPDGAVWVAARGGVSRIARGAARFQPMGRDVGLPEKTAFHVLFARDGTEWVGSMDGAFFRRPGQRAFTQAWPRMALMSMAEGPDGTIWAADDRNRYYRLRTTAPSSARDTAPVLVGTALRFDREGCMWLMQTDAIERVADSCRPGSSPQRVTLATGLSGPLPQSFFQDRKGNLWVGTSGGLDRLRRNRVMPLQVERALDHPGMVAGPDGRIWVGSYDGDVLSMAADGSSRRVLKGYFSASHRGRDGGLWFAHNQGLRYRAPDGTVREISPPPEARGIGTQAIQEDAGGALWVSFGSAGLYRLKDDRWTRGGGIAGWPAEFVISMALDQQGAIWMGHAHNRISILRPGQSGGAVRRLDEGAGLALGSVLCLYRDGPRMWAAGERGVMLHQGGRFLALRGTHGEAFRGVSGMVRLEDGDLWLHGADGAYRIEAAALAAWLRDPEHVEVGFTRFDALDGLRGQAAQLRPLPSLVRAEDGILWFATGSAVALVDPARIYRNPLPPPVLIRSVAARGDLHDVQARRALALPKGTDNLRIQFTGLALGLPERVRFRYRLQGVDAGWQEGVGRRAASYTNLAPGSYRFEVTAANEDGVWNPQAATLDIDIPATFVQTGWFRLALVLALGLALYAGYALRIRYLTRRMEERLQGRLEERSRIARSLHDTVLQSVQGLLMSFGAHLHALPEGTGERAKLERVLRLARRTLLEGRDEIMDLRAGASPGEMHRALEAFGQELAQYGGHAFALHVAGVTKPLKPQVRDDVYAIGREALFNAARHAGARQVAVELDYGASAFTLRVRDDGSGLAPEVAQAGGRPGHWGLTGMRERAAHIGAAIDVASTPGQGTRIVVTVPARLAYGFALFDAQGRFRRWLRYWKR